MEKFNRKVGSKMNHEHARNEIKRYVDKKKSTEIQFALFGRDIIDEILNDENCHGIKMELAEDEGGMEKIILYGVNESGDVIPNSDTNASMTCPPFCNPN